MGRLARDGCSMRMLKRGTATEVLSTLYRSFDLVPPVRALRYHLQNGWSCILAMYGYLGFNDSLPRQPATIPSQQGLTPKLPKDRRRKGAYSIGFGENQAGAGHKHKLEASHARFLVRIATGAPVQYKSILLKIPG